MKNFIYSIVVIVLALLFNVKPCSAAFPVHDAPAVSVKTEKRSFEAFINSAIERYQLPVPPAAEEDEGGKVLNLLAFGLGITGAISLIALFLVPAYPFVFGALALVASIAAIITGDKAMELRPLRGLGTAGFVLGIIDLAAWVLIGVVAMFLFLAAVILLI